MRSTFRIGGPAKQPGKTSTGTVFIMTHPIKGTNWNVMVTANHVLEEIQGDSATLCLAQKQPDGSFTKVNHPIQIREHGTNLWTRHPNADVATMVVSLPKSFLDTLDAVAGTDLLAGDEAMQTQDLCPGEELYCLGFPLGLESNPAGFPILRSGRISSFPVYPSKRAPQILLDARVFGGNSGGPVFFDLEGRRKFGTGSSSLDWRGIAGVLSQDISHVQQIDDYFESSTRRDPLGIAVVVPAQFIKETIELMMREKK
jgi:hypothetical protein